MSIKMSLTPRKFTGGVEGARRISSGVAVVLVSLFLIASSAYARTLLFVDSTGRRMLVDTENPGYFAMPKVAPAQQLETTRIRFTVTYMDVVNGTGIGFDDPVFGAARRETVELALEYIDLMLGETGAADIVFEESLIDGTEFFATAGTFFAFDPGFTNGVAFDHITTGVDPDAGVPDIYVTVDFAWDWNVGSGLPGPFEVDLLSSLIHELTHGLGLLSLSDEFGQDPWLPGVFAVWDKFLETGNGNDLWNDNTATFIGMPSWLLGTAGGVVFAGTNAVTAFGSSPPVYAPDPWESGSSLSHFDVGLGAVMEPFFDFGPEGVRREHTPVEIGALQDLGYVNAVAPSALPEADFSASSYTLNEGDGTATITVQLSFAPGPGNTAQVDYATSDVTAVAGSDYAAGSGTLTFGPTDTTKTFAVPIIDDAILEADETLTLTLTGAAGTRLAEVNNPSSLAILDDDPDADGDGISDDDESDGTSGYVTEPGDADTDDDGMKDGWEVDNGIDPTDGTGENGADGDLDNDGSTNLEEYLGGTDPLEAGSVPGDLLWSSFIGGTMSDEAHAIAVDSSGAVYVTGQTTSADFTTPATLMRESFDSDAFILKLSPDGTSIEYWDYIGGSGDDSGESIVVDSSGRVYIAGWTTSDDFPMTSDGDETFGGGYCDGFITVISPEGSIEESTYVGGSGDDYVEDIALDGTEESVYIVGWSSSRDLPVSANAAQRTFLGAYDAFVGRLDGVSFDSMTYLGGTGDDFANAVAVNSQDEVFIVGETAADDFRVTSDALYPLFGGGSDGFVTRINADLSEVLYSTYYGGSLADGITDIAIDSSDNLYLAGFTGSDDFPVTAGAKQDTLQGVSDGFLVKIASGTLTVSYATYLGGEDDDFAAAVAVDRSGMAYVSGYTSSSRFPATLDGFDTVLGGDMDGFLAVAGSRGSSLAYATFLGGDDDDWATAVTMGEDGHVFLTGGAYSDDFPITGGVFDEIFNSDGDAYVAKFDLSDLVDPDVVHRGRKSHGSEGILEKLNPCFIATAAYGTPTADQVRTLLKFRDAYLLTNRAGCAFVRAYYRLSPPVARFIEGRPLAKKMVRGALAPVVILAGAAVDSLGVFSVTFALATALFLLLTTFSVSRVRHRLDIRRS